VDRNSLELWKKYGEYLLMVFPSVDNVIDNGEGCWLIDVDGNRILDLASGQLCATVGTMHPKLAEKASQQIRRIAHTGTQFFTPAVFEAASKLAAVAPKPLKKSVFLSTGGEANEFAFRVAKTLTGRTGIVGLSRGYYGMTLATRSISSISSISGRVDSSPTVSDSFVIPTPKFRGDNLDSANDELLNDSLELIGSKINNVAAIIVEPFISAGGMIIPPPGYLKKLREIASRYGILLIADEAQTAFGRTGEWFAVQHHGIVPDILVFSKSAGGGFPASGILLSEELSDKLERSCFTHLASHQSDPLAATAVSTVIDIIQEENLITRSRENGQYFLERLRELQKKWGIVKDIRGQGLMIGVELNDSSEANIPKVPEILMVQLCLKRGVHLSTTYFEPVLRIMPPLVISRSDIDFAVSALDDSFRDLMEQNYSTEELLPKNTYSRRFMERLQGKRDVSDVISKLWNTPPRFWMEKLRKFYSETQ
jgi:2,2-dialkylglycine decarboxylase (pyruvate)